MPRCLPPCEAHLLAVAAGTTTLETQRAARGWGDGEWELAHISLRRRSWIDERGRLTAEGTAQRDRIESTTDTLAAAALDALDDHAFDTLVTSAERYADRITAGAGITFPNAIALPEGGSGSALA